MTEKIQKTILENGLRILSDKVAGVRSVSVGVLVDAGPKDERENERGYAHMVEHMLFQGTGARDARAIAEMMEVGGGAIGAFTARDYTVYHATVLDDYLPFALEALGDMLGDSIVPQEALERQQSVILNEIAGGDAPSKIANRLLKEALWPGHSLGSPTAGNTESIKAATRESLLAFLNRHYIADKIIVAAAGNVEHDQFVSQARDSFWQMKPGPATQVIPPPQMQLGMLTGEFRESNQVYFSLGWPAPPYTGDDRYGWHVLASLFGGSPTSRLYRTLREERGLVYHIGAQYQAYGNAGVFVVEGATLPQTLVPVLAGILIELLRMGQDEPDVEAHYRAAQSLVSQHLVSGDSAYVRMSRLALQEFYFQRPVESDEVVNGLNAQEPENIQRLAMETFQAGLPTISLVGPVSDEGLQAVQKMMADFGQPGPVVFAPKQQPVVVGSNGHE